MRLEELNALDPVSAERELLQCCGSARWARLMAAARPFPSGDALASAADRVWTSLEPDDWLQAFAAHPRIGDATRSPWEASEQRSVRDGGAAPDQLSDLYRLNGDYEARFGYIFIVCATGKTAGEILGLLGRRMQNSPERELRVAAEEQRQITRLRLARLLTAPA